MIKMIVAADRNNAIGWLSGEIPWRISADMKRFKELTTGHTILMGRRTFDSLKRPNGLPNRHNVVITNDASLRNKPQDEPHYFRDGDNSLRTYCQAHQACLGCEPSDLWIIGGATVYNEAIRQQLIDEIYLTKVDTASGADVKLDFNLYDWERFRMDQLQMGVEWYLTDNSLPAYTDDGTEYTFITLRKK